MGPSRKSIRRGTIEAGSSILTILFSDLVRSTELLSRLGDDAAGELRRMHFRLLRDAVRKHRGTEVKSLGDGVMATFASAIDAVKCAIAMQQSVHRQGQANPDLRLEMRIGLHAGEPLREHDDYFGSAVVIAKRLCDSAEGGEIIASELVESIVGPRGSFRFADRKLPALKGVAIAPAARTVVWEPSNDESQASETTATRPSRPSRQRVFALLIAALVTVAVAFVVLTANRDPDFRGEVPPQTSQSSASPRASPRTSRPELDLAFEVDDKGWLNSLTSQAVITGTVRCSARARVRLEITLVQGVLHRREARTLRCDGADPWAVVVDGPFARGSIGFDAGLWPRGKPAALVPLSSSLTLRSCMKIGTLGDNNMSGSLHDDVICTLAGDDTIDGGGGNDELRGFDGDDVIVGSSGDDELTGGYGKDIIRGGTGDDVLYGDAGGDVLRGGPGFDRCLPGERSGREFGCEVIP